MLIRNNMVNKNKKSVQLTMQVLFWIIMTILIILLIVLFAAKLIPGVKSVATAILRLFSS